MVLRLVDEKTRLVGLIHGSNITGTCMDLQALVAAVKRRNPSTLILADGVQYAPHAPVDVEELGVDAYVFGPYKVFCVKGIGFAYLSDRVASLNHWALTGKASDDWILGSADNATYAAWSAVVDYLVWLGGHFTASTQRRARIVAGLNASDAHCRALLSRCLHGAQTRPGLMAMQHVTVHAMAEDLSRRFCLILFNLTGMDSFQAVELYRRAGIRLHNRTRDAYSTHTLEALGLNEGIRLSASHVNSPTEIDAFLDATEALGRLQAHEIAKIPSGPDTSGLGEG
jgi:selenocysteine lyase/cysteine desulfurase